MEIVEFDFKTLFIDQNPRIEFMSSAFSAVKIVLEHADVLNVHGVNTLAQTLTLMAVFWQIHIRERKRRITKKFCSHRPTGSRPRCHY